MNAEGIYLTPVYIGGERGGGNLPPLKINEDIELSTNLFTQTILGQFRLLKLKS